MRAFVAMITIALGVTTVAQRIEPVRERSLRLLIVRWSALDLKLDDDQMARVERVRTRPTEDSKDDDAIAQLIERTLSPAQRTRWEQLSLQYSGLAAAGLPNVARRLGLGERRRKEFAQAGQAAWARMQAEVNRLSLPAQPTAFDDERTLSTRRIRRFVVECVRARELDRLDAQLETRLTRTQRERWQKMLGKINEDVRLPVDAGPVPPYPEYRLLGEVSVQRDLRLSEDAIKRIDALLKRASMLFDVPGVGREEAQIQVSRIHRLTERHLSADQLARLRQITIQTFGLRLIQNRRFAEEMGIPPSEVAAFRLALGRELRDQRIEMFRLPTSPGPRRLGMVPMPAAGADFLAERAATLAAQEMRAEQAIRLGRAIRNAVNPARLAQIDQASGRRHSQVDRLRSLYSPI